MRLSRIRNPDLFANFWALGCFHWQYSLRLVFCSNLNILKPLLILGYQLYYHYLQDPEFHQNAFALLLIVIMARSTYVMEVNIRPSLKEKYGTKSRTGVDSGSVSAAECLENGNRDRAILKNMWMMVTLGLAIFLGGFGIWNLDNHYCSKIRSWRHQVGLPWGIILEGHGWW